MGAGAVDVASPAGAWAVACACGRQRTRPAAKPIQLIVTVLGCGGLSFVLGVPRVCDVVARAH